DVDPVGSWRRDFLVECRNLPATSHRQCCIRGPPEVMEALTSPAEKGDRMFREQGKLGRIVAAVALTTVLSLAGPVGANAAVGRISPADPWSWLKGWWQG